MNMPVPQPAVKPPGVVGGKIPETMGWTSEPVAIPMLAISYMPSDALRTASGTAWCIGAQEERGGPRGKAAGVADQGV